MGKQRNYSKEHDEYMRQHKCCELCGTYKRLELHHVVPIVCGGSDRIENWIAICTTCHAKLTPKSELTKIGLAKAQSKSELRRFAYKLFKRMRDEYARNADEILDILFEELESVV